MASNAVIWQLHHPNGQSAQCSVVSESGAWSVRRWLNGFVAGAEQFPAREDALTRAADFLKGLQARGFRED